MPQCSRCAAKGFLCKVGKESSRCAECVRSATKCDCRGPSAAQLERFEQEECRLDEKTKATDTRISELHEQLRDQYARSDRLRRQKRELKERGSEMLRRGIQSLDELDLVDDIQGLDAPLGGSITASPSGEFFRELSAGFWESLPGSSGGIAAEAPGISQDS